MKEQLSAFIDNELSEFEERRLLAELERDPALRETWDRYHLIRAALRNELDLSAGQATASRVSDGIANQNSAKGRRHWARPTARIAGTVAIAASVAVITLVGLYSYNRPAGGSAQLAAGARPAVNAVPVAAARWNTGKPELDRTLNGYLAGHNEVAGGTGVGGVLPYVRVVEHEEARPAEAPK